MAKRKKKHHRRRRHVGALSLKGKGTGMKLAALAGGFFLGDTINNQIDKLYTSIKKPAAGTAVTIPNQMLAVGELGVGGLLLMKKGGNKYLGLAGGVLAGAGVKRLLKSMGVLSGYQAVPVVGRHRMAGYQQTPVIGANGRVMPPQLSGRPAQLQGFRVNGYTPTGSGVGVMGGIGSTDGGSGSGITNTTGSGLMG